MAKAPEGEQGSFKNARRIFGDIASKVERFDAGKEVESGIVSIAAPGHTPGHTAYAINSGNQSMLYLADTTNNPWLFVRNPEWQAAFDMDGAMAVETRKKMLTAPPPTRCGRMVITGRSRLRATSRKPRRAPTSCPRCGSQPLTTPRIAMKRAAHARPFYFSRSPAVRTAFPPSA